LAVPVVATVIAPVAVTVHCPVTVNVSPVRSAKLILAIVIVASPDTVSEASPATVSVTAPAETSTREPAVLVLEKSVPESSVTVTAPLVFTVSEPAFTVPGAARSIAPPPVAVIDRFPLTARFSDAFVPKTMVVPVRAPLPVTVTAVPEVAVIAPAETRVRLAAKLVAVN
jgi:hypothetical protein